jgi:diguanylate cyclase (GGDEF)-like protein
VEDRLSALTVRLVEALHSEPFDPAPGLDVGAALVDAHFTSPETLGHTVELLGSRLLAADGRVAAGLQPRVASIQGRVAAGYAAAMRERVRSEQEAVQGAIPAARQEVERELRASQERLRHQARHDPLTGLANRTLLLEELDAVFAGCTAERVALCLLDLDGFREVNDRLGHAVGDRLLVAVASRLGQAMSGSGHLVARTGGDEFVILLRDPNGVGDAIVVAEAALATLTAPIPVDGHELSVTASLGIVERSVGETSPHEVMRAADVTMYWAKADGRGRWALFDPERNAQEMARYELSATMLTALERGEFTIDYQPLVALSDGALLGMEALVRWDHPRLGLLAPDRFIGLAEATGLIVPLGRWVLSQACRQAFRWQERCGELAADPPYVSVNLAVRQTMDPGLAEDVTQALEAAGLEPGRLQLEITESAAMRPAGGPVATLTALRDMGVGITIDDFGTGYSNLSYLRSLPVHGLKLDRAFVCGLGMSDDSDPVNEQIVTTLVSMAHALGLSVTAEGVETAAQADRLRAIGADVGQGRYFAPPGPPDLVTKALAARHSRAT